MAHIRRHPESPRKWQVRYVDPTGRERSKTFDRKLDAERYLTDVEARKQRGEWINPDLGASRFADWAADWMATRSHLKASTLHGYESLLRAWVLPFFGDQRLDRIDAISVDRWVAEMLASGLSASRTRQAYQVLNAILKAAVATAICPRIRPPVRDCQSRCTARCSS